jgi:1-acyl-sn-glycerol-3-phosphate acyltransferase
MPISFGSMTAVYALGRALCRFVHFCCVREVVLHGERLDRDGGFVLACTHVGHLDPLFVALRAPRPIDWMARIEFYRYHLFAHLLKAMDAFSVNRRGTPVRAIRTAISRVGRGRVVGMFPEGGVARGAHSVMKGGPFKQGACVVAYRSDAPIVPVVVVGTDALARVAPWLPFKRARIWMIVGEPVYPRTGEPCRRATRRLMADDLAARYRALYLELCGTCALDSSTAAGTSIPRE